jgi:6-phosphogluconate dehydrogenase (decarboxylating)
MRLGMMGLGRMGANMVRRLLKNGHERFSSRGEADYADRLLSAMRFGFGGHLEKSRDLRTRL